MIRKLLDKGNTWVKLSSVYQNSRIGPPTYADVSELTQAYVQAAPEADGVGHRLAAPDRKRQRNRTTR